MTDPTAPIPAADDTGLPAPDAGGSDMVQISMPKEILDGIVDQLGQLMSMLTAAQAKAGDDINKQKGAAGAPDENSPEALASELEQMRGSRQ